MVVSDNDNESTATKNAGESLAILIAMAMQRYNAGHIAQWSTSGTSLEATGCRYWLSACAVRRIIPAATMFKNSNQTH